MKFLCKGQVKRKTFPCHNVTMLHSYFVDDFENVYLYIAACIHCTTQVNAIDYSIHTFTLLVMVYQHCYQGNKWLKYNHRIVHALFLYLQCGPVAPYGVIELGQHWFIQVTAWTNQVTAPSHYLNQCWLMFGDVFWHSFESKWNEGKCVRCLSLLCVWKLLIKEHICISHGPTS